MGREDYTLFISLNISSHMHFLLVISSMHQNRPAVVFVLSKQTLQSPNEIL